MSTTYRTKPVEIEAVQFTGTGESCTEVTEFLGGSYASGHQWKSTTNDGGWITTPEGDMEFRPGDWIIRDIKGEFYPRKPDIFAATYEPAEGPIGGQEPSSDNGWLIWSNEHRAWWRADERGYIGQARHAGRYSATDAERICNTRSWDGFEPPEVAVYLAAGPNLASADAEDTLRAMARGETARRRNGRDTVPTLLPIGGQA